MAGDIYAITGGGNFTQVTGIDPGALDQLDDGELKQMSIYFTQTDENVEAFRAANPNGLSRTYYIAGPRELVMPEGVVNGRAKLDGLRSQIEVARFNLAAQLQQSFPNSLECINYSTIASNYIETCGYSDIKAKDSAEMQKPNGTRNFGPISRDAEALLVKINKRIEDIKKIAPKYEELIALLKSDNVRRRIPAADLRAILTKDIQVANADELKSKIMDSLGACDTDFDALIKQIQATIDDINARLAARGQAPSVDRGAPPVSDEGHEEPPPAPTYNPQNLLNGLDNL